MTASRPLSSFARRFLLPLGIVGSALLVAVMLVATKAEVKPVKVSEKAWLIAVDEIHRQSLSPTLTLYGKVESLWSSQLTAGVTADVLEIAVIDGDRVQKGELLIRLDDRDAKLQLAQREAELLEADARIAAEKTRHAANVDALPREKRLLQLTANEVGRLEGLVEKKVSAQTQLDSARQAKERQAIALTVRQQAIAEHSSRLAELAASRVRVEALRDQASLEVARCIVVAPFNGLISRLHVAPGKRVRTGDPLIDLYDTEALVVRAQVPSRYLPAVRKAIDGGHEVTVAGSIDGEPISATLRGLAGEVSERTGGVEGLFEIAGEPDVLQQGRFVRLDLKLPAEDGVFSVPYEAIYGRDTVYRVDADNRMRAVTVDRVGEDRLSSQQTRVLIRSAELEDGTRIVVTQLPNAVDGLLLRIASGS